MNHLNNRSEKEIQKELDEILAQEKELEFNQFTCETALELGLLCVKMAKERGISNLAIDITRGEQQLFHYAFDGASADNDAWILRKTRTVRRFSHSSWYMHLLLEKKGKTITEAFLLNENEFAAHGGAFPIRIKNCGCAGTITVSGLPQKEDHEFVVDVLRFFLNKT